jgi:RNA polymerase sigma factor (sigma-70 family)
VGDLLRVHQSGVAHGEPLVHRKSMAVTETGRAAESALDDLYRRHGSAVYRYALAVLGNHADAEDVTQTTFLNAYRSLSQGVRPRKPANWLLTIASNAIKQSFRQKQARPHEVVLDYEIADKGGDEEGPTVGELLAALSRIPAQQRQAIVLREFEGRSYAETAEILGISTSALETLLFRARRSLAEELEHRLSCTDAQLAVSRAADGRLGRKERRRLREHLLECPDCAHFARIQQRHRRALRGLALIPVPVSLGLLHEIQGSAAAAVLPAGASAAAAGAGSGAIAAGGGGLAGGVALKIAAVVAAATVAGGATVAGVSEIESKTGHHAPKPAPVPAVHRGTDASPASRASRGQPKQVTASRNRHVPAASAARGAHAKVGKPVAGAHARGATKLSNARGGMHTARGARRGTTPTKSSPNAAPKATQKGTASSTARKDSKGVSVPPATVKPAKGKKRSRTSSSAKRGRARKGAKRGGTGSTVSTTTQSTSTESTSTGLTSARTQP